MKKRPPPTHLNRWIAAGVLGLLTLGFGGYLLQRGLVPSEEGITATRASQEAVSDHKMIVVLPFENLGAPEDNYFADGMTEEIISRLVALDGLGVISRTSAMQYKESPLSLRQIGEELGVDYVLEGTVRRQRSASGPGQVRVTPQLIRVSEDTHLWAERYDAVPADIFEVQSDIAKQVIEKLDIVLLEPQRRSLESRPTENLEAYDAYLRGNDYLHRGKEVHSRDEVHFAIQMYEEALQLDPTFALAHAQPFHAHAWLYGSFDRTDARLALAKEAVDRALELDPGLPEAHYALGLIYSSEGDRDRTLEEYQIVLRSRPGNAEVLEGISFVQAALGQWEESRITMRTAMKLNPRLGRLACWAGGRSLALRDFSDAIRSHDRAIQLVPDRSCPYYCKGVDLSELGREHREGPQVLGGIASERRSRRNPAHQPLLGHRRYDRAEIPRSPEATLFGTLGSLRVRGLLYSEGPARRPDPWPDEPAGARAGPLRSGARSAGSKSREAA